MKSKFIPQFIPYWDKAEIKAVEKVLDSDYLNEHKTVRKFETEFAKFVGARYCVTCTSGTTALYLGLKTVLEKTKFKKINIPDYAGIFVGNVSIQAGLEPKIVDVGISGCIDKPRKNQYIVHSNGRIVSNSILEDCCQAITHHSKNSISSYSFASTKHLTTGGQGGAICCDDRETFDILTRLKDHGRTDRQDLKPMGDYYPFWGMNSKFTEIQAAFGLAQLKKLPQRLNRLQKMYQIIAEELSNIDSIKFLDIDPKWYLDILVPEPEKIKSKLQKRGIQVRRFYRPVHKQPVFKKMVKKENSFPNSNYLYDHGLWLPSTTNLSDNDIMFICENIRKCVS